MQNIYIRIFFLLSFFLIEIKTVVTQKQKSKPVAAKKNVVRGSRVQAPAKKNVIVNSAQKKNEPAVPVNEPVNNISAKNNTMPVNNKITLDRIIQPNALNGLNVIARSVNMSIEEFFTQYITLYAIIVAMQVVHTNDMQEFSQKLMGIKADEKKLAEVLTKNMEKIVVASSQHNSGNLISLLAANMRKLALYIVVSIADSSREGNVCRDTFNMICDRYKVLFEVNGRVDKDFKSIIHREMQILAKSNKADFLAINVNNDLSQNSLAGSLLPQLLNFVACPPTENMTREANAYADLSYTLLAMILSFNGIDMNQIQFEKLSERNYAYIAKWVGGVIAVGVISALIAGAVLQNSDYVKNASDKDGFWKKRALGLVAFKNKLINPVTGAIKGAYRFVTDREGYKADKVKQQKQLEDEKQKQKQLKEEQEKQQKQQNEKSGGINTVEPQQGKQTSGVPKPGEQIQEKKQETQNSQKQDQEKTGIAQESQKQGSEASKEIIKTDAVNNENQGKSVGQMLNDIGGLNEEEYEYNPVRDFGKRAIDYIGSGVHSIFKDSAEEHLQSQGTGFEEKTKEQQEKWQQVKPVVLPQQKVTAPVQHNVSQSTKVEPVKNDANQPKV